MLQAVVRLVEAANMIQTRRINKTRGLLTVNHLIQGTIEEGILHIELPNRPRTGHSYVENKANRSRLGNRVESLVVVDARTLRVPTNNPARLIASKSTI